MAKKSKKEPAPEPSALPNKPQRGLAIGDNFGWTGKLPVTLLNEHCQKQKWSKCVYDMTKRKNGFIGCVTLNWENPKSKQMISLKYVPSHEPKSTTNEARHMVATFVLHRVNYIKNMKMLLPVLFRDYWTELETERLEVLKQDKSLHDRLFNVDPFMVYLQQQELNDKLEKQRLIKEQNESKVKKPMISLGANTSKVVKQEGRHFSSKVWDNAPFIDIPSELRTSIEDEIKHHIIWTQNPNPDDKLLKKLHSLGFRETHIKESLNYGNTFTECLEWLLFHIPEDDLPSVFMKTDKDSKVQLKISQNLQFEYALKRLKESGFDTDSIISMYNKNNQDEVKTIISLTKELAIKLPEIIPEENSLELWNQEIEGLEMMGVKCKHENHILTVPLKPKGIDQDVIGVKIFKSENYPNELPGIQITILNNSHKLANYVKLSIIKTLIENLTIGECMIYTIIEWLEENILDIINNPGSLILPVEKKINNSTITYRYQKKARTKVAPDLNVIESSYVHRKPLMEKTLIARSKLPAFSKKDQIVNMINSNKVTLITGETGSGKSTQVVQFILDDLNAKNDFKTRILCTQPRRISTIGLAERISDERCDTLGQETGYIIRGENKTSNKTRISFVTTGVLLRMIQSFLSNKDDLFENLGYIFIDEVHERSIDCDFLLIILKRIIKKYPVKIVLMSATIDAEKFNTFFNTPLKKLHIEGRTFPIKDFYLDSILTDIDYSLETYDGVIKPKADSHFFQNGNLNYDLISQLTLHIDRELTKDSNSGSILIFLPGILEINQTIKAINKCLPNTITLPLHSALSPNEQKKVFKQFKTRKIVVSTNVAETSITIPDCVVVIDTGRSKTMFFDSKLNTTKLIENWCSKAEIGQRRGRSGRITNGTCYHLYTETTALEMIPQPIPEIKRTKLENLYLVVKAMGISKVEEFLNSGLDSPDQSSLINAKKFLHDIGALENDHLSNLGKYISYLPTDPSSGKLLILGCIFDCLDICLTLAAISSTGSPFLNNFEQRDAIKQIQKKFANNHGDLIGYAIAYQEYVENGSRKFLGDNFMSYTVVNDIKSTRTQYKSLLQDLGFVNDNGINNKNYSLIRAIVAGSYYPQVARVQFPNAKFYKSAQGSIEIDPDAKKIKYWIRNVVHTDPPTRVFIHPSSVTFSDNNDQVDETFLSKVSNDDGTIDYSNARKLMDLTPQVSKSQNTVKDSFVAFKSSHHTTKFYVRDITPVSAISILLFGGGNITYDLSMDQNKTSPGVILDDWLPVRTWCKNGVLIRKLRDLLDDFIEEKLSVPNRMMDDNVVKIIDKVINI